ncbi:MAG: cellulase family glycosylhydrolase [bacterium]
MSGSRTRRASFRRGIVAGGLFVLMLGSSACADSGSADGAAPSGGRLRVRDGWFVDASGRVVLLHGVNVVDKRPPYLPSSDELSDADADAMRDLGFNVVRLGFIWKGLEPERGVLDRSYLARLEALVKLFTSRGIYVLVDAHQDLWNERFGGEGAPDWAVFQPAAEPVAFNWGLSYFLNPPIGNAFEDFWQDREGTQSRYVDTWREVARTFADEDGVLGYDVMNEPWTTAAWFVPQESATTEPFYRRIIPAIREVDPAHTVFWALALPGVVGIDSDLGVLGYDDLALSFHVYCATSIFLRVYLDGYCAEATAPAFDKSRAARDRQASGWLLTEFGASDFVADIARHADVADQNLVGWTHWAWKRYDDPTGDADEGIVTNDTGPIAYQPKIAVLERTYARAVAGVPTTMRFDSSSGAFDLAYTVDPTVRGPTEIWLPLERHYASGYALAVEGGAGRVSPREPHLLEIESDPSATEVRVTIRRAS